jgi:hypothetical protein
MHTFSELAGYSVNCLLLVRETDAELGANLV